MENNYIFLAAGVSLVHFFKLVPSLGSVPGSPEWMDGWLRNWEWGIMERKGWGKRTGKKDMQNKTHLNLLLRMRSYFWHFAEVLWKLLVPI